MLAQHNAKSSDETLSGVRMGCQVLQHAHVVQQRGGDGVVRKQLKKELKMEERLV